MKTLQGTVTSLKNNKTATVLVETKWQHPLYKKYVKKSKRYACHVENMEVTLGDVVTIEECKPISKTKYHRVVSVSKNGVQS
jgi:small subunit ribosomal protein S17